MAAYNKFQDFPDSVLRGYNDFRAAGDTVKIYLTSSTTTPSASLDTKKADLAEITGANLGGYTAGGEDVVNDLSETTTAGTWEVDTTASITWTSTETGTTDWSSDFQYVVAYNDSAATPDVTANYVDLLIGWWDYGSAVTLGPSESFTVTFTNSRLFTLA